jgi:hypothetical protein
MDGTLDDAGHRIAGQVLSLADGRMFFRREDSVISARFPSPRALLAITKKENERAPTLRAGDAISTKVTLEAVPPQPGLQQELEAALREVVQASGYKNASGQPAVLSLRLWEEVTGKTIEYRRQPANEAVYVPNNVIQISLSLVVGPKSLDYGFRIKGAPAMPALQAKSSAEMVQLVLDGRWATLADQVRAVKLPGEVYENLNGAVVGTSAFSENGEEIAR